MLDQSYSRPSNVQVVRYNVCCMLIAGCIIIEISRMHEDGWLDGTWSRVSTREKERESEKNQHIEHHK